MTESTKRGRPRKGALIYRASGYRARITVVVAGEPVQQTFNLGTTNRQAARLKLARLLKSEAPQAEQAKRVESFEEAAERIAGASTIASKALRLARLRSFAYPAIGARPVDQVRASDVQETLDALAEEQSRQSVVHLKNDISAVLGELWRTEVLSENAAKRTRIPKSARVDTRERAVLTDAELVRYLGWQHPDPAWQPAVLERQTMACVARMFGGLRLGDLRALRWEAFEIDGGNFPSGWAPRKKTKRPQRLETPTPLRPILRDWWERSGRPSEGFLFPVRRGKRASEQRKHASPAAALRRDLRRAFGIERPVRVGIVRSNGRPDTKVRWEPAREPTARERELLEPGEFTQPVEFHSFRRAFKQALAEAGMELSAQMALSGATDVKAHQRYLANTGKARTVPAAALPIFCADRAENQDGVSRNLEREMGLEPTTPSLGSLCSTN